MSRWTDHEEAQIEFLRYLSATINEYDPIVLVLRGSLLLRHWFGARARPAADIDLECFERIRGNRGERFPTSLVDHGRGLCCFAAEEAQNHRNAEEYVSFDEVDAPADGHSLWDYGTPGERFFAGWRWHGRHGQQGRIQIDIAAAGSYGLPEISVADLALTAVDDSSFRFPAYSPEMMLAAKLSWLLRGLQPRRVDSRICGVEWKGEPKDLFDVDLLLTKPDLDAAAFQKSLLAIGAEDKIVWTSLDVLFQIQHLSLTDVDFPNWAEFRARHKNLDVAGPADLLNAVAVRLEPLLGDFYIREEMPFLLAINAEPLDELNLLIYADWLDERGFDQRSQFLRLFAIVYFPDDELADNERVHAREVLLACLRETSLPWLNVLFGTSMRFWEVRQSLGRGERIEPLQGAQRPWWKLW